MTKEADFSSTTMTILANQTPRKAFKEYASGLTELASGHWEFNYNYFWN